MSNDDYFNMYGQQMLLFAIQMKAEDMANIKVPQEANPVKGGASKVKSRQGGKPPVDYTAVEMLADLQQLLIKKRYRAAHRMWLRLKRLTNA
jgi:hypothetical protein